MFYEKCLKIELDKLRDMAIMTAHSVSYATPAQSKKHLNEKKRTWRKYIDSVDWNHLTSQTLKTPKGIVNLFKKINIPTKNKSTEKIKVNK